MAVWKRKAGPTFLALGFVFLGIGLVHQDFLLSFESGFFNLGVIFVLSGAVASALNRKSCES